jgi:hypothetical protein
MIGSLEILCDNEALHTLLTRYRQLRKQNPGAEWNDRVMELPETPPAALSKLHGTLLALGWIETRVSWEAFETPGKLTACYRITNDGLRALHHFDHNMGLAGAVVAPDELTLGDDE